MRIVEIYRSTQGEGLLTGTESVFVRVGGCNLRCRYCDTPYAVWEPGGEDLGVEEIASRVIEAGAAHVVLTGGEPMLFAELVPLSAELRRLGRHVTVETAATRCLPVECDLMSISPKLSNSTPLAAALGDNAFWVGLHERRRHAPDVIRRLVAEYEYQVKFVVDRPEDCREVERYLADFPEIDRGRVMLMPQGIDPASLAEKESWLAPYCSEHGILYCPRRQIEWFGLVRGT
jgi:7-carboxy-7-deazaguanine synthase